MEIRSVCPILRQCCFALLVLPLFSTACSGGNTKKLKSPCEERGFPCRQSEVPDEVQRKTLIATTGATLIAKATSLEEAASWLESRDDIAEVDADSEGLRFRFENGRPGWVFRQSLDPRETSNPPSTDTTTRRSGLVAGEPPRHRGKKRALVLAPTESEFAQDEICKETVGNTPTPTQKKEGKLVVDRLSETHGYDHPGGVTYRPDRKAGVDAFKDWEKFDVIHLTTHGVCVREEDSGNCWTVALRTGERLGSTKEAQTYPKGVHYDEDGFNIGTAGLEAKKKLVDRFDRRLDDPSETDLHDWEKKALERLEEFETPGVDITSGIGTCATAVAERCHLDLYATVGWQFFKAQYGVGSRKYADAYGKSRRGLKDTFLFLNGCESITGKELIPLVLLGRKTGLLGWNNSVDSAWARNATDYVYRQLAKGHRLSTILDRLDQAKKRTAPKACRSKNKTAYGRLEKRGQDVRIREVIELPYIADGSNVSANLYGYVDDTKSDILYVRARVRGVHFDDVDKFKVKFKLDGKRVGRTFKLSEGSILNRSEDVWKIAVGLRLEKDFSSKPHDLKAIVKLPEGGKSKYVAKDIYATNTCETMLYSEAIKRAGDEITGMESETCQNMPAGAEKEPGFQGVCVCGFQYGSGEAVVEGCRYLCSSNPGGGNSIGCLSLLQFTKDKLRQKCGAVPEPGERPPPEKDGSGSGSGGGNGSGDG